MVSVILVFNSSSLLDDKLPSNFFITSFLFVSIVSISSSRLIDVILLISLTTLSSKVLKYLLSFLLEMFSVDEIGTPTWLFDFGFDTFEIMSIKLDLLSIIFSTDLKLSLS